MYLNQTQNSPGFLTSSFHDFQKREPFNQQACQSLIQVCHTLEKRTTSSHTKSYKGMQCLEMSLKVLKVHYSPAKSCQLSVRPVSHSSVTIQLIELPPILQCPAISYKVRQSLTKVFRIFQILPGCQNNFFKINDFRVYLIPQKVFTRSHRYGNI